MEYRFKAGLGRRLHVERESMGVGQRKAENRYAGILKTTTDTSRSPHTLVITKVGKEMAVAKKNSKRDEKMITTLNNMIGVATVKEPKKQQKKQQPKQQQPIAQPVGQPPQPKPQQHIPTHVTTLQAQSVPQQQRQKVSSATESDLNVSVKRPRV